LSEQKQYNGAVGFIQFDVKTNQTKNGRNVRNFAIRAFGKGSLISVSVWDDFSHVPLAKGDAVMVEGDYTTASGTKDGRQVTYINMNAKSLFVNGTLYQRTQEGQVNAPAQGAAAPDPDEAPF
jgi:hypothetical protein